MRKVYYLLLLVVMLMAPLCLAACGTSNEEPAEEAIVEEGATEEVVNAQEPVTLVYAASMANTTIIYDMMVAYADAVYEATDGAVTMEIYPGGQLYDHDGMPGAVSTGAVDMGEMDSGVMGGMSEAAGLCTMSFLIDSWEESLDIHTKFFDLVDQELQANNIKLLYWMPYGTDSGPITVDKKVTCLEDLKGLMIRGIGTVSCNWLNSAGANAVSISSSEVYQSLSSGAIDGAMSGYTTYISRGWYECCKYLVGDAFNYCQFLTGINLDTWDSLTPETQQTMIDCGYQVFSDFTASMADADASNIETLEGYGLEVSWLTDEEYARWQELMQPIYEDWASRSEACTEIMDYLLSK